MLTPALHARRPMRPPGSPGQFVERGMLAASDAAEAGGMLLPVPESFVPMLLLVPPPVVLAAPEPACGTGTAGADGEGEDGDGVMGAELFAGSPGLVRSQALRARADATTRGAATHQREAGLEVRGCREEVMEGSLCERVAADRRWSRHAPGSRDAAG